MANPRQAGKIRSEGRETNRINAWRLIGGNQFEAHSSCLALELVNEEVVSPG